MSSKTPLNILEKLEEFISDFNALNNEHFSVDSIRIEFSKQYKLSTLSELGNWSKIEKNSSLIPKLKKRLLENEITSSYRLEKHNIYYFNKRDIHKSKYRNAELVIFGMKQYHKDPPPRELITKILSILKDISTIDICLDMPYKQNLDKIKQLYTLTPFRTVKGVVTSTSYINTPEITMIEKIVIYNKQLKNNLNFKVWRVEAKVIIPNVKLLALPLYEFKELIDLMRDRTPLQIAKEI
jgi:hypothetical protein